MEPETFGIRVVDSWRISGALCDVDVVVEGRTFPCHRLILASESLFFRARFLRPLQETGEREVPLEVEQVTEDAFEQILRYIYHSEDFQLSSDNVGNLIVAADFLQVRLTELSCQHLKTFENNSIFELKNSVCVYCEMNVQLGRS